MVSGFLRCLPVSAFLSRAVNEIQSLKCTDGRISSTCERYTIPLGFFVIAIADKLTRQSCSVDGQRWIDKSYASVSKKKKRFTKTPKHRNRLRNMYRESAKQMARSKQTAY